MDGGSKIPVADTNERETLSHVLGFCHQGDLLRNNRRYLIMNKIAAGVKMNSKKFTAPLPTTVIDEQIFFAVDRIKKLGYISDPTVRFETYGEQPLDVDMEKKQIY